MFSRQASGWSASPRWAFFSSRAEPLSLNQGRRVLFKDLSFRALGPYRRVVGDFRRRPRDTHAIISFTLYVGTRNGACGRQTTTARPFEPIFDGQAKLSIGDVPWPRLMRTSSGSGRRSLLRRSSNSGDGVYKFDGRRQNLDEYGLRDSHHNRSHPRSIRRIRTFVFWRAMGHLFSTNADRRLQDTSTADGGHGRRSCLRHERSGAVDIVMSNRPLMSWVCGRCTTRSDCRGTTELGARERRLQDDRRGTTWRGSAAACHGPASAGSA